MCVWSSLCIPLHYFKILQTARDTLSNNRVLRIAIKVKELPFCVFEFLVHSIKFFRMQKIRKQREIKKTKLLLRTQCRKMCNNFIYVCFSNSKNNAKLFLHFFDINNVRVNLHDDKPFCSQVDKTILNPCIKG